jgi:hypothetical protein
MTERRIVPPASPLVGPEGKPLYPRVELRDLAITYTQRPGESFQANPEELLMAMARRQRDGSSHEAIMVEFDLSPKLGVTHAVLERALKVGRAMLDEAIARGEVPAETHVRMLVYEENDDDA